MAYEPKHAADPAELPAIFAGLADQIEPVGSKGYRPRHSNAEG